MDSEPPRPSPDVRTGDTFPTEGEGLEVVFPLAVLTRFALKFITRTVGNGLDRSEYRFPVNEKAERSRPFPTGAHYEFECNPG